MRGEFSERVREAILVLSQWINQAGVFAQRQVSRLAIH